MMKKENESYLSEVISKLTEHKMAMAGLMVILLEIILVVVLPLVLKLNPYDSDYTAFFAAPDSVHILGTDAIGRDVFARLIYGGRTSLLVGFCSTIISCAIGAIMRVADVFMSFPSIVLILVLVAVIGPSIWSVTLVIGVLGWTQFARLIYANVLSVSEKEYVESARAIGTPDLKIITQYILPNSFAPILIAITFQMASAILMESSLSFLGMGVQPPGASWGNMLYDAQSITVLSKRLWIWMPPGIALLVTVLSINFLGDGIRDALDPKIKI